MTEHDDILDEDDPFGEKLEPSSELGRPDRSIPVADGRRQTFQPATKFPAWPAANEEDVEDTIDYSDLEALNRDLNRLRVRTNRVRLALKKASREAAEAKTNYSRAYRRALVKHSGGSAEARKAMAEITCEELEADMIIKNQIEAEYTTLFRSIRDDVENAKTVAYNLRAIRNI
jgi:hypothetical protein